MLQMESDIDAQVVTTCDDCGEDNDVQEYCLDCHGKLCKKCKEIHLKKRLTSHHRVLSLTDPQSVRDRQSASVPCVHHPGKVYSTFCKKCQIACCSDCMVLSHSKHEFLGMEEAAENARDQTKQYSEILAGYHDNDIPSCIDKIEERISDVATKRKRYRDKIKKKADSLRKTLEEFEGKLNDEVDQMLNSEENALKMTLAKVKDNKETISFVMNTCEQRLNHVNNLQILTLPSEVPDISTLLLPATTLESEVTLGISKFKLSSGLDVIGKLSKSTKQDKILDKVSSRPNPAVVMMQHILSFTTEGAPDKIVSTPRDDIWIRNDSVMRKYNIYIPNIFTSYFVEPGTESSKSDINLVVNLYDICMSKDNVLLGTDQAGKRVVAISDKGDMTTLHDVSPLVPSGIFINDKQELFVGLCSENLSSSIIKKQILVFSEDGESEVRYETNAIRQPLFRNYVHRITQGNKGDCIVIDGSTRVVCIGQNKYVKWTYHGSHISDITYDSTHNRTFICDVGKHEIVALCLKGCQLNLQLPGGIKRPISLGKCKSGIVVGEEDNTVSVWHC